jgi:small subunit ribosomal protein S5
MEKDELKSRVDYLFDSFGIFESLNLEYKVIQIRNVSNTKETGRVAKFSVMIACSSGDGRIGLGFGKSSELILAKEKALADAQNNLFVVPITSTLSIKHSVYIKYKSVKLILKPARVGTGLNVGGATYSILEMSGVKNIRGKHFGCTSYLNSSKATILALLSLS